MFVPESQLGRMFHSGCLDLAAGAFLNIQNTDLEKMSHKWHTCIKRDNQKIMAALVISSCLTYCRPACSQSERLDKRWYFTGSCRQGRNSIVVIAQCAQTQIRYKLNYPDLSQAENSWETNSTVIIIFTDGCSHHNDVVDTNIFSPALCTIDTVSQ